MKRVMVIDDEKDIVKMIDDGLSMFGFSVHFALDGKEGLKEIENGNFDLVITDINLPGCNGNEIAEEIRCSCRHQAILFGITGDYEDFRDGLFDAVFHKPFSLFALMKKIQEFLPDSVAN